MPHLARLLLPITLLTIFSVAAATTGCSKDDTESNDRKAQQASPAQIARSGAHVFVGYSKETVDGAGNNGIKGSRGIAGLYAACRSVPKFGPAARMCTSEEYARSPKISAPTRDAWVQPVAGFRAPKYFPGSQAGVSCRSTSSNILDWGSVRGKGLTISTDGTMRQDSACNVSRPVTCCAPR